MSISDIFGRSRGQGLICPVKRTEGHDILRVGSVFEYACKTLAHKFYNKYTQPYILAIPLHPKVDALFHHKDEEMLFVPEGMIKFFHSGKESIVKEGGCIYFDGSMPHCGISE